MATPIENLRIGHYVAIVGIKGKIKKHVAPVWSGEPFRIENFSLPFVAVKNFRGEVFALDARQYDFQRLSRGYVGVMRAAALSKLDDLKPKEQNAVVRIMQAVKPK